MKLLICCSYYYYGHVRGIEPQFYYLYKVPESMGYEVDFFDYISAANISPEQMRRVFLSIVNGKKYDAVFIATHKDEFDRETLAEAQRTCPIVAWNSDDEWRWEEYSKERAEWYTYMVTNSPEIYQNNKQIFPQLLHAQWACTGFWDGRATPKDIDFSFVGQVYGSRAKQIQWLAKRAKLQAYGAGTANIVLDARKVRGLRSRLKVTVQQAALRYILPGIARNLSTINFDQVNLLWNRSKISFTPLDSSRGRVRQIKSRIFDMGLSGTLMIAQRAPYLDTYYEPEKEYIPFDTLEECADKVSFYLRNEAARSKIAEAYAKRTEAEHMWSHRIRSVLCDAGIQ
jgi:hypothetical protein